MTMLKKKSLQDIQTDFRASMEQAMTDAQTSEMIQAITTYSQEVCDCLLAEHNSLSETQRNDASVLAARGVRQLTSQEHSYYSAVIEAMTSTIGTIKSALTDISVVMPETVIDAVMEDIGTAFPLLDAIDFRNTSYLTTWLYNKQGVQTATWGQISGKFVTELSGAFGKMNMNLCKLMAYMPISKDYLALGPAWLDRYVRALLSEAIGVALEVSVVDGSGNADGAPCPIGMTRDLTKGKTENDLTTYEQKTAIAVTSFTPAFYGGVIAELTKTETGRTRTVNEVILVCNPEDYLTKVMPATTYMTPQGTYVNGVLPFPTQIVQANGCPKGKAVVGLAKRYFAGLGVGSKAGVFDYDDSVQFLEDNRIYTGKLIGNGRPLDNNAFVVLDISALEPLSYSVTTNTAASGT